MPTEKKTTPPPTTPPTIMSEWLVGGGVSFGAGGCGVCLRNDWRGIVSMKGWCWWCKAGQGLALSRPGIVSLVCVCVCVLINHRGLRALVLGGDYLVHVFVGAVGAL